VKLILGNLDVKNPEPGSADESYINHPNYRALVLRKNVSDMGDWINKAQQIYKPLGGVLRDRPLEFRFPSGAMIVISHLDDELLRSIRARSSRGFCWKKPRRSLPPTCI
jgi:hypothetical protein